MYMYAVLPLECRIHSSTPYLGIPEIQFPRLGYLRDNRQMSEMRNWESIITRFSYRIRLGFRDSELVLTDESEGCLLLSYIRRKGDLEVTSCGAWSFLHCLHYVPGIESTGPIRGGKFYGLHGARTIDTTNLSHWLSGSELTLVRLKAHISQLRQLPNRLRLTINPWTHPWTMAHQQADATQATYGLQRHRSGLVSWLLRSSDFCLLEIGYIKPEDSSSPEQSI